MPPTDSGAATSHLAILEAGARQLTAYRSDSEEREQLLESLRAAVWTATTLSKPDPERDTALVGAVVHLGSTLVDCASSRFRDRQPADPAETALLRMCIEALQNANLPGCFGFSHRGRWETVLVYCGLGGLATSLYNIPHCS